MSEYKDNSRLHCASLNSFFLEKAVEIERVFTRYIVYLSMAAIIISLLFLQQTIPLGAVHSLGILFISWALFFSSILFVAGMIFFGAIFKDIMFEGTLRKIEDYDNTDLYKFRSHWSGTLVYISGLLSASFFIVGLGLFLLFLAVNISNLSANL